MRIRTSHRQNTLALFHSLLEQIKSPKCKAVVGVLQAAKSKSLLNWRQLDIRITDAANEAKDNVKYLYTLDKFFGPLVKCSPVSFGFTQTPWCGLAWICFQFRANQSNSCQTYSQWIFSSQFGLKALSIYFLIV